MNKMTVLYIAGGIIVLFLAVAAIFSLPDIRRYIKINRM